MLDTVTKVRNLKRNEPEEDADEGLTQRALLSLVVDISQLHQSVERVKVQVYTLAKRHGIEPPEDDGD